MFCGFLPQVSLCWWHGQYFLIMGNSGKVNKAFTTLWLFDFSLLSRILLLVHFISPQWGEPLIALSGFSHAITKLISFPFFSNLFKFISLLSISDAEKVWIYTFISLKSYRHVGLVFNSLNSKCSFKLQSLLNSSLML